MLPVAAVVLFVAHPSFRNAFSIGAGELIFCAGVIVALRFIRIIYRNGYSVEVQQRHEATTTTTTSTTSTTTTTTAAITTANAIRTITVVFPVANPRLGDAAFVFADEFIGTIELDA